MLVLRAGLSSVLLWASSFPGITAGLIGYSPLELAAMRFLIASIALAIVSAIKGCRRPKREDLGLIALLGLVGVTSYHLLLNAGETHSDSNTAAFLTATAPLFTTIIARSQLGERVSRATWFGIPLGLVGVAILFKIDTENFGTALGPSLLVVAALCWGLFFVLQKPLLRHRSPLEVTTYAVWVGSLPLLPFMPQAIFNAESAPLPSTLSAAYLGLGPTAVAYVLWAYVLSNMPAARASLLTYLTPLVSVFIRGPLYSELLVRSPTQEHPSHPLIAHLQ